jgi:hypothetical protein
MISKEIKFGEDARRALERGLLSQMIRSVM